MALSVTHTFVSAIPDDPDALASGEVLPQAHWNAVHSMSGVLPVANGGTGITSFGTGIDTFLGTPSSANLATAVTDETGTGALVFANTPTFVTPILGTPTSGNLANCTGYPVGSISGTVPATAGGTGLTSYAVGDIVYADTTTTLAKLADVATGNALISGGVGTAPSWGKIALATAVSGNLPVANLNSGTNADNTHFWRGDGTWAVPASGGTPGGSSLTVQYNNASAFGGMSGTSWDDTNRSLTMTGATVTTSNPVLNMTQTWNAGAVVFDGLKFNVTNTASATGSALLNLQIASAPVFVVLKSGFFGSMGAGGVGTSAWGVGNIGSDITYGIRDGFVGSGDNISVLLNGGFAKFYFGSGISGSAPGFEILSTGLLAWSSTAVASATPDLFLSRSAAATLQFGAADAAAATAQTTQVQSVVAGTSNTAGADWTFQGSRGTGTGIGGNFIFQCAPATTTGTAQNTLAQVFKISGGIAVAAGTSNSPGIQIGSGSGTSQGWYIGYYGQSGLSAIWNTGVTPGTGNFNIASDSNNLYLGAVQSVGLIKFYHGATGNTANLDGNNTAMNLLITSWAYAINNDVFLTRGGAAATWQYGRADAATATAQTTQVQSVVAGTANGTAGADWTFKTSSGTGTGTGGNFILKTPFSAKSSGTGQGTWVDRDIYVSKGKVLTSATPVSLFEIALPAGAMAGGTIYATIICTNGTDMQSFSQSVSYSVVNKAGTYTKSITAATGDKSVTGASTLTTTWTLLDGTNKSTVQVSATTSLTPSTNAFICYYSMANNSEQATTIL